MTKPENETSAVGTYVFSDPGDTLTLSLSGADAGRFSLSSGGVLTFISSDYEDPQDAGRNNVYDVTVVATDDGSPRKSAGKTVAVTVTDVNEPPTVGGRSSVTYRENGTYPVATYTANDPEGDSVTWTPKSGGDAGEFSIDSGVLRFGTPPDYEAPQDGGSNNVYDVTVVATDDGSPSESGELTVTVTVTDVDEAGTVSVSAANPAVGATVTATLSDPDTPIISKSWRWERSTDGASWSDAGTGSSYTVAAGDRGVRLKASVTYTDRFGSGKSASSAEVTVQEGENRPPEFQDGETTKRGVDENTPTDQPFGSPVVADDDDGDTLTYSISGADAGSFSIDAANGQLKTDAGLNYEAKRSYSVRVGVSDGRGGSDDIAVTINVGDVDEPPGKPTAPTVAKNAGDGQSRLDAAWSAPSNTGPPITGYGVQYREGSSGSFKPAAHSGTRTRGTISGLKAGTCYEVQVQATNDEGTGAWSDAESGCTAARDRLTPPATCATGSTFYVGRSLAEQRDNWDSTCRRYRFNVRQVAHVVAMVESRVKDPVVRLERSIGGGRYEVVDANDDSVEAGGHNALAWADLDIGWYNVVVYTADGASASDRYTLRLSGEEVIPTAANYHQADRTVAYVAPPAHPLISAAVTMAAAAWNVNRLATICEQGSCGGKNGDGYVVTVQIRAGDPLNADQYDPATDTDCGWVEICVVYDPAAGKWGEDMHYHNLFLRIENPAYGDVVAGGPQWFKEWTDAPDRDGDVIDATANPPERYRYIGSVMMHEFGHTLGLEDLVPGVRGSIMTRAHKQTSIPDYDIRYLHQLYRRHMRDPH